MRKFIITETRPVESVWTYEIEAENEQDALEQVFTGKAEVVNYEIEDNGAADDSRFEITEQ
jgi:hypothetical protein